MNRFDTAAVIDLAQVVERDGLDAHASTLFALADRATSLGVSDVVISVMLGSEEPFAARLRAFTLVAAAVAHRSARGYLGGSSFGSTAEPVLV